MAARPPGCCPAKGAKVIALSRTQADLDGLKVEIGCTTIAVDLADPEAARQAAREGLPADYLVNCAGINILESFVDVTVEAFDLVHAVNTRAADDCLAGICPKPDRIGGGGAIVNVSSLSSFIGFDDHALLLRLERRHGCHEPGHDQ